MVACSIARIAEGADYPITTDPALSDLPKGWSGGSRNGTGENAGSVGGLGERDDISVRDDRDRVPGESIRIYRGVR